jgi:hypothetical protein
MQIIINTYGIIPKKPAIDPEIIVGNIEVASCKAVGEYS